MHSRDGLKNLAAPVDVRVELLSRCPLFRGLVPEVLWLLASATQVFEVRSRHVLFHEGDRLDSCWMLTSGLAKVMQSTAGGREVIHRLVGPGELLSSLVLESRAATSTSAIILEPSLVLSVQQAMFEGALIRYAVLGRNAVRVMAERLRQLEEDHVSLASQKLEVRLAAQLVRLAEKHGRVQPEGLVLSLTREDLADLVGASLFSVSRQLGQWEADGLLISRRNQVAVVDGPALLAAAAQEIQAGSQVRQAI